MTSTKPNRSRSASIRVTITKEREGVYSVRWREGGRRPRKRLPTKALAEEYALEVEKRLAAGDVVDTDPQPEPTLAEFVEEYWTTYAIPNLLPSTRTGYGGVWERHLRNRIGDLPISQVTSAVIEDAAAQMKVGDPTKIKALGFLQGVMKRAAVRGHLPPGANPVRDVKKPRQRGIRRAQPLAPETIERIRQSRRPYDRTLVSVLAYAGLRPAEAQAALLEHITGGSKLYVPATNHWPHDRYVDLLPIVQADLREWIMQSGQRTGLIFPRPRAGVWTEQAWRGWRKNVYQPAARAAGVTDDLRPYRLRGSYGSLLLFEGRSPMYVADQLGHDLATLSTYYAGVIAELEATGTRATADQTIRTAREATSTRAQTEAAGSSPGPLA